MTTVELKDIVPALLRSSSHVEEVELRGSRADGTATTLSDWDFVVNTCNFDALSGELPALMADLRPLAQQWDRLSKTACYMLVLAGPTKVDLIFESVSQERKPSWTVSASTLTAIDAHFWDWILWLTSKAAKGRAELIRSELDKMSEHLLGPMGVREAPASLADAVTAYVAARTDWSERTGGVVSEDLEREVAPVVRSLGGG